MKKATFINLSLLIIVGLLVLLTIYEPGIEKPPAEPKLLPLDRESIHHIVIKRDKQETVELEKNAGGEWRLLQPAKLAASKFRIDSLLRITETKDLARFSATPEKLAQFKLDKPKAELILNNSTHIAFGTATPLDQRRYVLLNKEVHLITDNLYYFMVSLWPTFVSTVPLPEHSSIVAMQLPDLKLQWKNDQWQLHPKQKLASADQITELLDAWKFASAMQVKQYGGDKGKAITVQLKDAKDPLRFVQFEDKSDLILARPDLGIEYHFPIDTAKKMLTLTNETDKKTNGHGTH